MIISSSRLLLRPWERPDLDALADLPPFPEPLHDDWNWPHALRENGTADFFFLGRSCDPNRIEWTILTTAGQIIGHLGIRDIDREARSARLGMGLGTPFVGQGYGYEALHAFLEAFFGPMEFTQMVLDVRGHNLRARRMYKRLGFRETETFWQLAGTVEECEFLRAPQYDLLRDDFRWGQQHVLVRCVAMSLVIADWRPHSDARELDPPAE